MMYIEKTYSIFIQEGDTTKAFAISLSASNTYEFYQRDEYTKRVMFEILNALEHLNIIDSYDVGERVKQYGKD